jgi:hypothetical protein
MPSLVSRAEIKPMVSYVKIDEAFLAKNKKDN